MTPWSRSTAVRLASSDCSTGWARSGHRGSQASILRTSTTISGTPERNETEVADGVRVEQVLWRNNSNVEVELVAVHGGGHGIPQPNRRHPRLLGPSPKEPNGPAVIWAFFERQRPEMARGN